MLQGKLEEQLETAKKNYTSTKAELENTLAELAA